LAFVEGNTEFRVFEEVIDNFGRTEDDEILKK
jgi:hypothetical protein